MTENATTINTTNPSMADIAKTVFVTGGSGFVGRSMIPALLAHGYRVRAMARSEEWAARVTSLGATAERCDLRDVAALTSALSDCHLVVHAAARFQTPGRYAEYVRDNVAGTNNLLSAARAAGVRRFVMVGAAGCLVGGQPVRGADESWPLQEPRWSHYFRTKTIADRAVRAADSPGFATCVVRPGLIWGGADGDPFLDGIAEATSVGKMMFIDGGRHTIVTSHVDNTIQAILLALERGGGGQAYFVFDDGTVPVRDFFAALLATRGLTAPAKSIPFRMAWLVASMMVVAWKILRRPGSPPISRELVKLNGGPFIVSDAKARRELGYSPVISREQGLEALSRSAVAVT